MLTPGTLAFDPQYLSIETMMAVNDCGVFQINVFVADEFVELAIYRRDMVGDETLWRP